MRLIRWSRRAYLAGRYHVSIERSQAHGGWEVWAAQYVREDRDSEIHDFWCELFRFFPFAYAYYLILSKLAQQGTLGSFIKARAHG